MKLKVTLNKDSFVRSYAFVGDIVGSFEATLDDNLYDDFSTNFSAYCYSEGKLLKNDERFNTLQKEIMLDRLRLQRRAECFPIINRGKLWYDTLTSEQLTELNSWYTSWLDVTETEVIPTKPEWVTSEEV